MQLIGGSPPPLVAFEGVDSPLLHIHTSGSECTLKRGWIRSHFRREIA